MTACTRRSAECTAWWKRTRDRAVRPGDPIDFDFSNQPPRHEPPAEVDGAATSGAGAEPPPFSPTTPETPPTAPPPAPPPVVQTPELAPIPPLPPAPMATGTANATMPAAPVGAPITDFRTQSYPFAVTSRFQQGGFGDLHDAPRASHRRRLAWGILAAVGAVLFAASVVVVMQVIDRAMHG